MRANKAALNKEQKTWMYKAILRILLADKNIDNSEMAVSLLQTAEGALDEVSRALIQARQVAVHAGNEGSNDQNMLKADQQEIDNILEQINRIATSTQYGHNFLLDGSRAGNGVTTGDHLEFVVKIKFVLCFI